MRSLHASAQNVAVVSLMLTVACLEPASPPRPLAQVQSGGNHYYAAPKDAMPPGNDENPCTPTLPCFTMQRISNLPDFGPGDTAHFASGNYTWNWSGNRVAKSGTASAPITYISDQKWGAKIFGSGCTPIYNEGDYVQIIHFDVTGVCSEGIVAQGNYNTVIGNRVHDLPVCLSGWCVGGIIGGANNKTGIRVIGNVVDNIAMDAPQNRPDHENLIHGIYIAGPNAVVQNNIVTRAIAACITMYHHTTHEIVSNNVVANCGRYGIQVSADGSVETNDFTTVNNNIVVNVRRGTPPDTNFGYGIQEYPATGPNNVYYNNIVYNNPHPCGQVCLITGTDSGTIELTDDEFNSLFVDYTGDMRGDYRLSSGARGIDEGTTRCASGVTDCVPSFDFNGVDRPQGSAYDIGAYETAGAPGAGPVASWSFAEGSGQTASDGSGNGNVATRGVTTAVEASDPAWVPGRINNALQYDTVSSSRATVAASPTINNLATFTYVAWVHPTATTKGRVFSKETSATFDEFYFMATTNLEAVINNTAGTPFISRANPVPLNTWSHIAVTYNDAGDRKLHLFLNGLEVGYSLQQPVTDTLKTTANTLLIGNRIGGDRTFQGRIDETKIYNRALSAAEIQSLFNATISGPVATWSFDEGTGQTAADGSGNENTSTLGSTADPETSDPRWVFTGRTGNALEYDGLSWRATVAPSPTINNLSAFTYAAWIFPTGSIGSKKGRIFAKESAPNGFDDIYFMINTDGTPCPCFIEAELYDTAGNATNSKSVTSLQLNWWSHVALTYNDAGDRKLRLYVNGSEVTYQGGAPGSVTGTLKTTSNNLIIGNRAPGIATGDRGFLGKIDEAKIYNRALSPAEIQALFNAP